MKYRTAVRAMCNMCTIVHRRQTVFITCEKDPRHKQKQVRRPNGQPSSTYR